LERFVLDTSLFTNPDVFTQFGENTQASIGVFLEVARRVDAEFFMPGSVYDELRLIKDISELAADYESVVRLRSPRKFSLMIPSEILYEFIEEVRYRIDKGLRIAEESTKRAGREQQDLGRLINRLRDKYREALRQGILDSKEDADVLLLAYELDGVLVSGDEGMRKWADKVGIKIINPKHFKRILENLARRAGQPL
jgi:RNA ligase partner protein